MEMTEHFTRKEAVALASTIAENDDYEFNLVNAAVTAKQKEWEAQGAVAKSIRRIAAAFFAGDDRGDRAAARAIMAMEVEANKFLTSDATHALPAQPAEPVNAELVAALEQTQGEAKSDLRGIDAGPFSEWLDLVRHGHVNRDECLIMVKDIPKWLKQNPQATEPAPTGCGHCQNPLYAGTKCKNCGRVSEPAPSTAGELTPEQITRIYDRYGGDMVNCTRAIERELAAARSQPTTEESSVVAGEKPVREPLSSEKLNELWVRVCGTAGGFGPFARAIEAAHGITKKGEQ